MPMCVIGGDQDTTVEVHHMLAEYLALPEGRCFLHIFHGVGHSPNVEVAAPLARVVDRCVTRTVPQCNASMKTD